MKTAIIIGGGLGGLFTGAILAKEGLRVTVLEKNATAGGGPRVSIASVNPLIQECTS